MTATISGSATSTLVALTTSGNTILGDASTDTLNVGNGGLVKDASGNVGIGTSSPVAKLDVVGSINFGPSDGSCVAVGATNTFTPAGGSPTAYYGITFGGFVTNSLSMSGYNGLAFYTNAGLERMRIDSSGNLLFNSGYGSAATAYGCRAWVNFNGTGTVAIRGSGNVSSITDNGVGSYTMNFTTAMPDTNYCCTMNGRTGGGVQSIITLNRDGSPTTTTNPIYVVNPSTPGILQDEEFIMVAVFR